jgi:hypothetical protein
MGEGFHSHQPTPNPDLKLGSHYLSGLSPHPQLQRKHKCHTNRQEITQIHLQFVVPQTFSPVKWDNLGAFLCACVPPPPHTHTYQLLDCQDVVPSILHSVMVLI